MDMVLGLWTWYVGTSGSSGMNSSLTHFSGEHERYWWFGEGDMGKTKISNMSQNPPNGSSSHEK